MALSEPFTVTTNQNPVAVKSSVPNSPSATLPDGKTSTFGVTIANNGPDDEVYFLDARQPTSTTEALAPTAGTTNTVQEPDSLAANTPPQSVYLVPTHTTHYTILAEGFDGRVAMQSFTLMVQEPGRRSSPVGYAELQ